MRGLRHNDSAPALHRVVDRPKQRGVKLMCPVAAVAVVIAPEPVGGF
jgi:hypothetical protein